MNFAKNTEDEADEKSALSSRKLSARPWGWFSCLTLGAGGVLFLLLTLPIVTLLARAVGGRGWEALPESGLWPAVALSFFTTAVTALLTLLLGTPLAYTLALRRSRWARAAEVLVQLPIILPPAVAGLALLLTLGRRGWLGGALDDAGISLAFTTAAVVIAQLFVSAPFYVRAAQNGFAATPPEIIQAARVDGASDWALFWRIMLPLSRRGLTAGLVLTWARAMGEFGATILFAGSLQGRTQTMPLFIYNTLERNLDAAMWAGVLLVLLALIALAAAQFLRRGQPEEWL